MSLLDRSFDFYAKRTISSFARREIVLQALLVGIIAGLAATLFRYSVNLLDSLLLESFHYLTILQKLAFIPFITTIGGLVAGILVFKIDKNASGSGIPEVKNYLTKFRQKLGLRAIVTKFFAGIIGIGSGMSLGREGPSVHLGAGAGDLVSRWFNLKGFKRKNLVAAGAGAAIGATFNAPIAATIFVMEELVHVFRSSLLFPVLIATVTASVLARTLLGNNFAFHLPEITAQGESSNIIVYIILGIVAGLVGGAFTKNILFNLNLFERFNKIPNMFKPAIAGFFTGLVGVFLPFVLGPGNQAINALLEGNFSLLLIFLILVGKFLLTSFCYGSGAAGGLFLPTIMLGAFTGYFVGTIANVYLGFSVDPALVSVLGMGAFLSAVVRTPITAVVIVFELTGDYNHILPIMLSAGIADLIADRLHSHSVYELLLERKTNNSKPEKFNELVLDAGV